MFSTLHAFIRIYNNMWTDIFFSFLNLQFTPTRDCQRKTKKTCSVSNSTRRQFHNCIFLPLSLSVYIIKYKYLSIHKMCSVCVYIYLISVISNLFESSCGGLTIILRDYKSVIIRTTKWKIKIFIEILYRYLMLYGIRIGTYNDINSKPVL